MQYFLKKLKDIFAIKDRNFYSSNRKRWLAASLAVFIIIIFWKFLPKEFSTIGTPLFHNFIIVCLLCLACAFKLKISEQWQIGFIFFILLSLPALCFYNTEYVVGNYIRNMPFLMVILNYAVYLCIFLILYALTNQIRITSVIGMSIFTFYALLNSFIIEFRGSGIRAADVFAVKTAINVSGSYELIFTLRRASIVLIALGVSFIVFHVKHKVKRKRIRGCIILGTFVYLFLLTGVFKNKAFMSDNEVKPYLWDIQESEQVHGALLDFVAGLPYLAMEKPYLYSAGVAKEAEKKGAEAGGDGLCIDTDLKGEKPDIIVIMNESFSDLRNVGEFETDEEYLKYFYSLQDNVIRGNVSVPVYGGLTANTEFEFITGFSTAFFPGNIIAYQNYVKEGTPNLNSWLQGEGYHSIFMHPMSANGWNRKNVYQTFGFNETYYIEDFSNPEMIRGVVSDSSNYKEVIKRYEAAKKENEHVFLFNVTMQNHGGYMTEDYNKTVHITDLKGNYPKTEEYLSLVRESDKAFEELIEYFSKRENPVIICMFGDHQPSVETEFYDEIQQYSTESDIVKQARKYQTPFILYSNYEMEEKNYDNISINYLQTLILNAASLPLNRFNLYLANLYENYPVVNAYGVMDADKEWMSWSEMQDLPDIKNYSFVQYWKLFDQ